MGGWWIVVVEPDRDLAEVMRMILAYQGHQVRLCRDRASAHATVRRERPDLVIV